jgi:hypothetical protein
MHIRTAHEHLRLPGGAVRRQPHTHTHTHRHTHTHAHTHAQPTNIFFGCPGAQFVNSRHCDHRFSALMCRGLRLLVGLTLAPLPLLLGTLMVRAVGVICRCIPLSKSTHICVQVCTYTCTLTRLPSFPSSPHYPSPPPPFPPLHPNLNFNFNFNFNRSCSPCPSCGCLWVPYGPSWHGGRGA